MRSKLLFFICLLTVHIFALDPPRPIRGTPNFLSGQRFTTQSGDTIFSFTFPVNWGLEEILASETSAKFTLFPQSGEFGSIIQIHRFQNATLANEEVERLKATFTSTNPIIGGFESMLKKAYYASYVNEFYVVQIWYSLPKRSVNSDTNWAQLKQCVSVSQVKKEIENTAWVPVKEIPWEGWVCNHPNNQLHVLLKSDFINPSKPNQDSNATHLLEIGDIDSTGFFYVKWDQKNLNTNRPYELHLQEIKAEILRLQSGQKFEKESVVKREEGWAFLRGFPYSVITISGDEFLFGFALKNKNSFRSFDVNKYIKRVSWWQDE